MCRVSNNPLQSVRLRILQMAEAVAVRIKKADLWVKEKYVQPVPLHYPTSGLVS